MRILHKNAQIFILSIFILLLLGACGDKKESQFKSFKKRFISIAAFCKWLQVAGVIFHDR